MIESFRARSSLDLNPWTGRRNWLIPLIIIRIPVVPIMLGPVIEGNCPKVLMSVNPIIEPSRVETSRKDNVGDGCKGFERSSLAIK